jgi:putative ABC transport system permease protein
MIAAWLYGLVRTRFGRIAGTVLGVALVVALLVDLGAFLDQSSRSMTSRALRTGSTDWQVELVPGIDPASIAADIAKTAPNSAIATVGYAPVDALEFKNTDGVQTTGAGKAVGVPVGYFDTRANDLRVLSGDLSGGVLLQQTAANLHAQTGDSVVLRRPDLPDAAVTISGIVDLKSADVFFQAVGVPPGAAPTAPPDNAILLPAAVWGSLFDPQSGTRPDGVRTELHVVIDRASLPTDPNAAYAVAASLGRNLEARVAGSATLANNIAALLDAARGDALYAKVLFLFLAAPGIILAVFLTFVVVLSGRRTRERDQALLKLRGASTTVSVGALAAEAGVVGAFGALLGLIVALGVGVLVGGLSIEVASWPFLVGGLASGLGLAAVATLVPALWSSRNRTFASSRLGDFRRATPMWQRIYFDFGCLALGAIVFWQTAASGYQIVLATEGVAATSVDYTAFLAPVLVWLGASLLTIRLARLLLSRGKGLVARAATPLGGPIAAAVAASLAWQRARIGLGVALAALAVAFLVSTAVFNATYEAQSRVDAELTNGADVTFTGTTSAPAGSLLNAVRKLPGVAAAEPMQHRYAYVGTDLQDLYGINAATITQATDMSNAFFQNGDAAKTLTLLSQRPDAVLVSDETVNDFQLSLGDALNLRLQGADGVYHAVPFVFAGVVREFPTAPHDSFLVANADYVSKVSGIAVNEIVLVRTAEPTSVKLAAQTLFGGKAIEVTSLLDAIHTIGSSLTAVDVDGLGRIELTFAVLLGIGATALALALGFADRRRDFAVLKAIGATDRHLSSFVVTETTVMVLGGLLAGTVIGWIVANILIVVLQGVFDPPPEMPALPWLYLLGATIVLVLAAAAAAYNAVRQAQRSPVSQLRDGQ